MLYIELRNDRHDHIINNLKKLKLFLKEEFNLDYKVSEFNFGGKIIYDHIFFNKDNEKSKIYYSFENHDGVGCLYVNSSDFDSLGKLIFIKNKFSDDSYLLDVDGSLINSKAEGFKRLNLIKIKELFLRIHPIWYWIIFVFLVSNFVIKKCCDMHLQSSLYLQQAA